MSTIDEPMNPTAGSLNLTAIQTLRASVRGTVLSPDESDYDSARRIWNGMIDRHPALIVGCMDDDDVIACVRFAREHTMPFTVRGGGHNVAGSAVCDGGLVIDLSPMKEIRVDPDRRRVHAGGGAAIGDLDRATQPFALAAPMGVVSETGIAGLTLGGGMGWLRRKHGLSCDALRSADVVTADGRLVHTSESENPDLFWGLRGGGGNFGIVTRFEYEIYPVGPEVFFLVVFYPTSIAGDVLGQMNDFMASAPDEFSPIGVLGHVPPMEQVPAELHGQPCILLVGPWIGDAAEGEMALAPLRTLGTPIVDLSGSTPYLEVQQFFDADYPSGERYYWKSTNVDSLPSAAIEDLIALNDQAPSLHSTLDIWYQGGAMARVETSATAFGGRGTPLLFNAEANWHSPLDDNANIEWTRRCVEAMEPYSNGGAYLNFPGTQSEGGVEAQLRATYGSGYERLVTLKRAWDPDNIFSTHQNIKPESSHE